MALLGFVDFIVARVNLEGDSVRIAGLFKRERIRYDEIESVRLDGGYTCLRLKTGRWRKLPAWLGANMSARRRIADRLKEIK